MAKEFPVETSARHAHVTQEMLETLFGKGYQLTVRKMLSQPGYFASNEKITVTGPKGSVRLSILGPCRKVNQIELAATDVRALGIDAPLRESGDLAGSGACKISGPAGEAELKEGVIIAKRHVHMTSADAKELGVTNGQIVKVLIDSGKGRKLIFDDTVVRVSDSYVIAMHIDTDESNAAMCTPDQKGTIIS